MGEAPEAIVLVESCEGVDKLHFEPNTKLAYLTQTTLSVDDANKIIGRLKERFLGSKVHLKKTSAMPRKIAKRPWAS